MSRMPRYHGSCPPPRPWGTSSPGDLMPRHLAYRNSTSAAGSAQASPQIPQQFPIMFVGADGERIPVYEVPIKEKRIVRAYAASNGESPTTEVESDDFEDPPSLATLVRKEERRRKRIFFNPAIREESGHHFGGYHPGKNKRQGPSIRHVTASSEVSRLLGLPVHELVSADMCLAIVEEQQKYEAWAKEVVVSNGHYK